MLRSDIRVGQDDLRLQRAAANRDCRTFGMHELVQEEFSAFKLAAGYFQPGACQ